MAQVFMDAGCTNVLGAWLNNSRPTGGQNLTLKLFVNDITPTNAMTAASFTAAAGGGYADKTLTSGSWTVSAPGGIVQGAYAKQTFTFSGALTTNTTIYGYYIVDADGVIVTAERLAASFAPANNLDSVDVTPIIQMSHGTPTA
jgi:hypothetical protein